MVHVLQRTKDAWPSHKSSRSQRQSEGYLRGCRLSQDRYDIRLVVLRVTSIIILGLGQLATNRAAKLLFTPSHFARHAPVTLGTPQMVNKMKEKMRYILPLPVQYPGLSAVLLMCRNMRAGGGDMSCSVP